MSPPANTRHRLVRLAIRGAIAASCALLLSGCVVYPAGPYGYRPGYYYGGGGGYYHHDWR